MNTTTAPTRLMPAWGLAIAGLLMIAIFSLIAILALDVYKRCTVETDIFNFCHPKGADLPSPY